MQLVTADFLYESITRSMMYSNFCVRTVVTREKYFYFFRDLFLAEAFKPDLQRHYFRFGSRKKLRRTNYTCGQGKNGTHSTILIIRIKKL